MASVTAQRVPGDMAGDNRDVADLWKDSLKAYKSIVGFDLEHKFESVEAMITQAPRRCRTSTSSARTTRRSTSCAASSRQTWTTLERAPNTEEIQKMTSELLKNQHSHTAMLEEQMQVMSIVRDRTESIRDDIAKSSGPLTTKSGSRANNAAAASKRASPLLRSTAGIHRRRASIRNTLMEVEGEDHEYHVLQETIMLDTCAWVFREPEWERWLNQQDPPDTVLVITGSLGTGKSHLAFSVYLALKSEEATKDSSRRTCVSQFYFREQNESLSSFTNGVISVIDQVAEQSPELCEAM
ncbi:hypothetical protein COL940_013199 [Colletotrichum noveboracense]|nr:hypothetical protein COL940_013199 [Colletotrichum noveboracense]KAJ0286989.1 hypothetical protein CBS470a_005568 [Colletotrichum nupharicola]